MKAFRTPMALLALTSGAIIARPLAAQDSRFADPALIDAQVAAFTGAPLGTPGGARAPVESALRLAACTRPLELVWQGRGADMVRVECPGTTPWRLFVPVLRQPAPAAAASAPVVERGQVLTITIAGRGFSVSQQGEALEEGAIGEWIEVRPQGRRETVRARIVNPALAVIDRGGA